MNLRKAGVLLTFLLTISAALPAQQRQGELRLSVKDSDGRALQANVAVSSDLDRQAQQLQTDAAGQLTLHHLPYTDYRLKIAAPGFADVTRTAAVESEVPQTIDVVMGMSSVSTTIDVNGESPAPTTGNAYQLSKTALEEQMASSAGRALIDTVNAQPGWLVEANGVLHPRGSEYQVQFVQDGFSFEDNRSPAFNSAPDPESPESLTVMTANYPAEFGRKLGGVIETGTGRDHRTGFHGTASLEGGSFSSVEESFVGGWSSARQVIKAGLSGLHTDRYLDPPSLRPMNDSANDANGFANFDRDLTANDNMRIGFWRGGSSYFVPNDLVQQAAGQSQRRRSRETGGNVSLRHVFNPRVLASVRLMARDLSAQLESNLASTPIRPAQERGFGEIQVASDLTGQKGRHSWKIGGDVVRTNIREAFSYVITDPAQFDPSTPGQFHFTGATTAYEQSLFAEDAWTGSQFTLSAGLRWDRYRVLVHDGAFSPRLGAGWQVPGIHATLYASYDRVFTTPAMENLLLSSSAAAQHLTDSATGLPVTPSRGNFYQIGLRKQWASRISVNTDYFVREVSNFADDDLLLNTSVSFPLSFSRARIHGLETKLEVPELHRVSGFVSYSNQTGIGYTPITGGLLLERDAQQLLHATDKFPISQDQRNTLHGSIRYRLPRESWLRLDGSYGSGLPVETDRVDLPLLAQHYDTAILANVNLDAGRVRPSSQVDLSAGTMLWSQNERNLRLQASLQNILDRVNVINFAGLLSGTAVAPPRHFELRARFTF